MATVEVLNSEIGVGVWISNPCNSSWHTISKMLSVSHYMLLLPLFRTMFDRPTLYISVIICFKYLVARRYRQ